MPIKKTSISTLFCLFSALILTIGLWLTGHSIQAKWPGIPPVPTKVSAKAMTLGDTQFSYRFNALVLQSIGDTGGRVTPVDDYNYNDLGKWFWLLDELDPESNHIPNIAAYYFGVTRKPENVSILIDYLSVIGNNPSGEKWRWLVQAIFLSRHRLHDMELSLDLAYKLSALSPMDNTIPIWARQMSSFVLTAMGEKQAAQALIEALLLTDKNLKPHDINFLRGYLAEELDVEAYK